MNPWWIRNKTVVFIMLYVLYVLCILLGPKKFHLEPGGLTRLSVRKIK